jgi:hypothetical protein
MYAESMIAQPAKRLKHRLSFNKLKMQRRHLPRKEEFSAENYYESKRLRKMKAACNMEFFIEQANLAVFTRSG